MKPQQPKYRLGFIHTANPGPHEVAWYKWEFLRRNPEYDEDLNSWIRSDSGSKRDATGMTKKPAKPHGTKRTRTISIRRFFQQSASFAINGESGTFFLQNGGLTKRQDCDE
jgi:hypothetical protein